MKYSFRIDVALKNFGAKIVFFTKRDKDILGNAEKSSALTSTVMAGGRDVLQNISTGGRHK